MNKEYICCKCFCLLGNCATQFSFVVSCSWEKTPSPESRCLRLRSCTSK